MKSEEQLLVMRLTSTIYKYHQTLGAQNYPLRDSKHFFLNWALSSPSKNKRLFAEIHSCLETKLVGE